MRSQQMLVLFSVFAESVAYRTSTNVKEDVILAEGATGNICAQKTNKMRLVRGGDLAVFKMPRGKEKKKVGIPCMFNGVKTGTATWICTNGDWKLKEHDCKPLGGGFQATTTKARSRDRAREKAGRDVKTTCPAERIMVKYKANNVKVTLNVPEAPVGKGAHLKCHFGDYNKGNVDLECGPKGKWEQTGDNCHREGECPLVNYHRNMHGIQHDYKLGRLHEGSVVKKKCQFGKETIGYIWFKCTGEAWTELDSICLKKGQCKDMVAGDDWAEVHVGESGDVEQRPCNIGNRTDGLMTFSCAKGKWVSDTSNCKVSVPQGKICPARDLVFSRKAIGMSANGYEEQQLMTYQMPAATEGVHETDCANGFEGMAIFKCHAGTWSHLKSECKVSEW